LKIFDFQFFVFPEIFAQAFTFFRKFSFFQISPTGIIPKCCSPFSITTDFFYSRFHGSGSAHSCHFFVKKGCELHSQKPRIRAHFSPRFPGNLISGSVWVPMTPRLIENSWSFYPYMRGVECQTTRGSGHLINPKRHPFPGSFRAPIPYFQIGSQIPVEVVPTPTENIVLIGYFAKIPC